MKKQLSEMTNEELWQLFPIILSNYNEEWPKVYKEEEDKLLNLFPNQIARINHIGSTSVVGLKAKPTIDILLELIEQADIEIIVNSSKKNGYIVSFPQDNPAPHLMLKKGYTVDGFVGQAFHIHIRYLGDWDELYFRDYLRTNENARKNYVKLKEELSISFEHDRDAYTTGKTEFIKKCTYLSRQEFGSIYKDNDM